MKWINLSKKLPDAPIHKLIVRVIGTNSHVLSISSNYFLDDKVLILLDKSVGATWALDELEWLDESDTTQMSGLSDLELDLEGLVDAIKAEPSTLKCIVMLKNKFKL